MKTDDAVPGLGSGALREALTKLSNEAGGMLGLSGVREAIGNTNMACLQLRVDEARALLSLSSPIEPPPTHGWTGTCCENGNMGQTHICCKSPGNLPPNVVELRERLFKLDRLLLDPHPGLSTWVAAYGNAAKSLLEFFADEPLASTPQASSEIREAAERIAVHVVEYVNLHKPDMPRPDLIRVAVQEMAMIELKALAPSRQGAAKRVEG